MTDRRCSKAGADTSQVLLAAAKDLGSSHSRSTVVADSGVENVTAAVDAMLIAAHLHRVLAQVEVSFSNSIIEAWWRSLKHQWLYLNSLDTIGRLRELVAFFVEAHNARMPHAAFRGQTPDEMYFGTAANLEVELTAARKRAIAKRIADNRTTSAAPGARPYHHPQPLRMRIHPDSARDAIAYAFLQNVRVRSCAA